MNSSSGNRPMPVSYRVSERELRNPDRKRVFNRSLFSVVAPRYDVVTRVLSFGADRMWKRRLLRFVPERFDGVALDIACGTGDIAEAIAEKCPDARVLAVDLNPEMITRAKRRLSRFGDRVVAQEGDMTSLPLADGSASVVTGGYALRNAPRLETAVSEVARVLEPGGTAAFLDFSRVSGTPAFAIRYRLLRFWGQVWGLILHGDAEVYGYIARSLREFPRRDEFHRLVSSHGFRLVRSRTFFSGIMELSVFRRVYSALPPSAERR